MSSNPADQYTTVDDKLDRTNTLLADLVSAQGTASLPEATDVIPYGTITVPDDRQYYGFPSGRTTFKFGDGQVTHNTEGKIMEIESISDLSRSLDSTMDQLRSIYVYVDAPCQLSLDGDNTRTLEAGQHYNFVSQGFTTATLESEYSYDVTLAASTRRESQNVASSGAHSERKGSRAGGTYDTWETMILASPEVWADYTVTDELGDNSWYVRPFGSKTVQAVNGSSAANDIDVRVRAKDVRLNGSNNIDDWYTIARHDNLSQNQRHKFVIDERHHLLKVQFQNSADTNKVAAGCTCVGGN